MQNVELAGAGELIDSSAPTAWFVCTSKATRLHEFFKAFEALNDFKAFN